MIFQYFFYFHVILFLVGMEFTTQINFDKNSFEVFSWWIEDGKHRIPVIFLLGLCGLIFTIFISHRSYEVYIAYFGKKETYIYLGDKGTKGFFGYLETDKTKTSRFIPTALDSTVYPSSTFLNLFHQRAMLKDRKGEYLRADFLQTGNLILWSMFHITMSFFSFAGFRAYLNDFSSKIPRFDLDGITIIYFSLVFFYYFISIILIKFKINSKELASNKIHLALPENISHRNIIRGKIIASEIYSPDTGSDKSADSRRTYYSYAIQFDNQENFDPPVCINVQVRNIHDGNLSIATRNSKLTLNYRKKYYDIAIEKLKKAESTGEYFSFYIDKDLCIFPYLDEMKDKIPKLLVLSRS